MSKLVLGQIPLGDKLPESKHHFSTLIFHNATYYELKQSYHKRYPSKKLYQKMWEVRYQKRVSVAKALEAHTYAVLRRSGVHPYEFKYMTTVFLQNNRLRHVSAVRVDDEDLKTLISLNALRRLHTASEERTREEIVRHVIYGLAPLSVLVEKSQAA